MSDKEASLERCLRKVIRVATDVTHSPDANVPLVLLSLGNILECKGLDSSGVREVKKHIWRCDLVHAIIEVLRQDFSLVEGHWNTATQLVSILVTACAGFNPGTQQLAKIASQTHTSTPGEQVQEFYEILLPTAADSVLILANNLLELESVDTAVVMHKSHLEQFQSVLDSLAWLCTSHRQCMLRALQSPYLLHILITDTAQFYRGFVHTLRRLIKADPTVVSSLPEDIIHSILDELVYKISGKEKQLGKSSLKLLSTLVKCCPGVLGLVLSRYKGLMTVVSKWSIRNPDADVRHLIDQLQANSGVQRDMEKSDHAATLIQATWRGFSTRKKINRMHKGIQRFQRLYRKRKAERMRTNDQEVATRDLQESRKVALQTSLRDFHEKQLKIIEQLPATQIDSFAHQQESEAATKIQSWWRGKVVHKDYAWRQDFARKNTSALVLQRSFRRILEEKRQKLPGSNAVAAIFPQISSAEREVFQAEITQQRELHPPMRKSELQSRQLHDESQTLLEEFCASRLGEQRKEEKGALLLSKLNRDCELLLGAPRLEDLTPEVLDPFTSSSASVARMAETAHREELKTLEQPWWKKPLHDMEPVSL